jgi:hypothetical protein
MDSHFHGKVNGGQESPTSFKLRLLDTYYKTLSHIDTP